MGIKKPLGRLSVIASIVFGIVFGCDPKPNEALIDYIIFNESGADIRIVSNPPTSLFQSGDERETIEIENEGAYSQNVFVSAENSEFSFLTFFGTDNINIYFNNERFIFFNCPSSGENGNCSDARNILKFIPDGNNRAEYTFTISDFESATPCDGHCD